jgi:hypothetical protein
MISVMVKRAMRDLDKASKFFGEVKQRRRRERLNPKLALRGVYFISLLLLYSTVLIPVCLLLLMCHLLADRFRRLLE